MSVLYIALPLALGLGGAALWACVYCIRSGQFEDLESPAMRMLIEEDKKREPEGQPDTESQDS